MEIKRFKPYPKKLEIEEIGYSENWNSEKLYQAKHIKSGIEYEFTPYYFSTN
jgi:hypothetical protein